MTREEHERLYALVQNPPPGSKMEAAEMYGVDLTLNLRRLLLTPTERAREMEGALRFVEQLREAAARIKFVINFEAALTALAKANVTFVCF
jgi:hypothetical protein